MARYYTVRFYFSSLLLPLLVLLFGQFPPLLLSSSFPVLFVSDSDSLPALTPENVWIWYDFWGQMALQVCWGRVTLPWRCPLPMKISCKKNARKAWPQKSGHLQPAVLLLAGSGRGGGGTPGGWEPVRVAEIMFRFKTRAQLCATFEVELPLQSSQTEELVIHCFVVKFTSLGGWECLRGRGQVSTLLLRQQHFRRRQIALPRYVLAWIEMPEKAHTYCTGRCGFGCIGR